mgnify:CR=1 FL=1
MIPAGVLGGVTTLLYGMIGMIGVQIWVDNKVDFSKPLNIMTAAIVMIIGIANFQFALSDVQFNGIAIGSIAVLVLYHGLKAIGRATGAIPKTSSVVRDQGRNRVDDLAELGAQREDERKSSGAPIRGGRIDLGRGHDADVLAVCGGAGALKAIGRATGAIPKTSSVVRDQGKPSEPLHPIQEGKSSIETPSSYVTSPRRVTSGNVKARVLPEPVRPLSRELFNDFYERPLCPVYR